MQSNTSHAAAAPSRIVEADGPRLFVTAVAKNVEFRLGQIEQLPVADSTVDVIISNCVINLSPDKARVAGPRL